MRTAVVQCSANLFQIFVISNLVVVALLHLEKAGLSSLSNFCCYSLNLTIGINKQRSWIPNPCTQRAHHVKSTLISGGYYVDTSKMKFRQISKSFPRTFFDVILMMRKSTSFPHTFFGIISTVEKSTLFSCAFLCNFVGGYIQFFSTYFFLCNFSTQKIHVVFMHFSDVISLIKKSMLFSLALLHVIWMVK